MIFSTMATNIREWFPYGIKFSYVKTETKVPIEEIPNEKILEEYFKFLKLLPTEQQTLRLDNEKN